MSSLSLSKVCNIVVALMLSRDRDLPPKPKCRGSFVDSRHSFAARYPCHQLIDLLDAEVSSGSTSSMTAPFQVLRHGPYHSLMFKCPRAPQ